LLRRFWVVERLGPESLAKPVCQSTVSDSFSPFLSFIFIRRASPIDLIITMQIFSAETGLTSVAHVPDESSCTPASTPLFSSPPLGAPGLASGQETFDFTFDSAGTYHFASLEHCAAGMRGVVTVIPESAGLPEIPREFEAATPVENVPLPDNGVITVAPTTTKRLTQQTPPPNVVAGDRPQSTTAAPRPTGTASAIPPATGSRPSSAQGKVVGAAGIGAALVAGALACL
jgi:hypothetical protein